MQQLESTALRDAEIDYAEYAHRTVEQWRTLCDRVRRGESVGPAADVLAEVGRAALCRAWGVNVSAWDVESGAWCRRYNLTWAAAVEVLNSRQR